MNYNFVYLFLLFQDSLIFSVYLRVPGFSNTLLGWAPFWKNLAPYSSVAIDMPIAFLAIAIGEYPTNPSKPSPGIFKTYFF